MRVYAKRALWAGTMGIADDGKAKSEQDHEVVAITTGGSQGIGRRPHDAITAGMTTGS